MGMSLHDVAERLNEAEIAFEINEAGDYLRAIFTTEADEYVDLDGNPSIALFLMAGENGVTIHSEPLLDVSKARFRGSLAQAALELMSRYDYVRARTLQDPLILFLTVEYLLEDNQLTAAQLKSAVEYLCKCCILAKPYFQTAMDTGKVDASLIALSSED